jgi:hypothetical protein
MRFMKLSITSVSPKPALLLKLSSITVEAFCTAQSLINAACTSAKKFLQNNHILSIHTQVEANTTHLGIRTMSDTTKMSHADAVGHGVPISKNFTASKPVPLHHDTCLDITLSMWSKLPSSTRPQW